ncbi:hypothetical protein BCR42DRAFT_496277 [Absidia repens]|uniref:Uncharacterized protein n=1 Tax=Absidia repens TaxID=90262 RepID=A0A1X2I0J6_9FUNG|nr:hypothetical protein BCR42DRAFT_496277 [Absidia repens]
MLDNKDASDLNLGQGANRFKYRSFNSRVESIKVDIVRRSRLVEDEIDENGSFFNESLQSWKELNLSKQFTLFSREIQPYCKTLPSILHHKDKIVDTLEKYLVDRNSLALDGLLDLVTKLAKDLEGEFYPYYPRMLKCMLPLVYHQDVKLLECLFNSMAYLFKFLSRQILPDICDTFDMLSKLLGEDITTKPYVRHFSAEAFAFLMRKIRGQGLKKLVQHILDALHKDPSLQYTEGLSMLFFESMKQIDNRLHSRAESIYHELYSQVCSSSGPIDELESDNNSILLNKTTLLLLHHTYRQHMGPIVNVILEDIDSQLELKEPKEKHLLTDISTLSMMATVRKASRIEDFKPIISRVQEIAKLIFTSRRRVFCKDMYKETLRTVTGILCFGNLDVVVGGGRLILESIIAFNEPSVVYGFFVGLSQLEWSSFTQVSLPYITRYVSQHFTDYPQETIFFLSQLNSSNSLTVPSGTLMSSVTADGLLRFPATKKKTPLVQELLNVMNKSYDWDKEQDLLNNTDIEKNGNEIPSGIAVVGSILTILPILDVSDDLLFDSVLALFGSLSGSLSKSNQSNVVSTSFIMAHKNFTLVSLLGLSIESLVALVKKKPIYMDKLYGKHDVIIKLLNDHSQNEVIVKGIYEYMATLQSSTMKDDHFDVKYLEQFYPLLKTNLRSYLPKCRLYTMKLLALFDQPLMKKDTDHRNDEKCEIVDITVDMESIIPSMNDFRDKLILIQKLNLICSTKRIPDIYADFVPLVAFGLLTVNFKPLWEDARKILKTFADTSRELYWTLCFAELAKFEDERLLVCDGFTAPVIEKCVSPVEISNGQATKTGTISFECPTFTKYTAVQNYAMSIMGEQYTTNGSLLFVKICGLEKPPMDFWHYYNMILQTLMETPTIVEQRARHLIPVFFKFLADEFDTVTDNDLVDDEDMLENNEKGHKIGLIPRSASNVKSKMITWLRLFACFTNIRGVYKSQDLYVVILRLIAKGDVRLQSPALETLFAWKDKNIKPYSDNLRNLLDDTKFRDELSTFIQNHEQNLIDPAHRDGLMPIVMRLLFGRLVERRSKGSKHVKKLRRKAILGAVSCCKQNEMKTFIDLALEPFQSLLNVPGETLDDEGRVTSFEFVDQGSEIILNVPWRQQSGLVNVLEDMIKQLGSDLLPFMPSILKVILYILHSSQNNDKTHMDIDDAEDEQGESNDQQHHNMPQTGISNRSKQIRSVTLRRLLEIFSIRGGFNFAPYISAMFGSFISPRLANFPGEASQQISSLLLIFAVWAEKSSYVTFLTNYDDSLLPQIYAILSQKKIDQKVLSTILDILDNLLDYCDGKDGDKVVDDNGMDIDLDYFKENLIVKHVDALLDHLKYRLTKSKDDKKFNSGRYSVREIAIVARLAPYTSDGTHTATILEMLIPNLKKPSRIIPEFTKRNILTIWSNFMPLVPGFDYGSLVYQNYYKLASDMFSMIQSRENRQILIKLFQSFVNVNPALVQVGALLQDLNSFSRKRIDEPDYDRMLDALSKIGEDLYNTLDHHQWLPILNQLFYSMQDADEIAVRGTATHCATRFLTAAKEQQDPVEQEKLVSYVTHVVYPAIKHGLKNRIEIIRMEFVGLLNAGIKTFPELPIFTSMVPLLGDNDEEVNFFNNIYHIQLHRRVRSMVRLSEFAAQGVLAVPAIVNVFIPLVSGFIYESDRLTDHNVIHQASQTIGSLAGCLPWGRYYRLLSHYLSLVSQQDEMEKIYVRLATNVLEAFHFDISHIEISDETEAKIMGKQKVIIEYLSHREIVNNAKEQAEAAAIASGKEPSENVVEEIMNIDGDQEVEADTDATEDEEKSDKNDGADQDNDDGNNDNEDDDDDNDDDDDEPTIVSTNTNTSVVSTEQAQKIHDILITKVLPSLNAFISKTKSRKSVISRMPVALGIAKLLRQLPEKSLRLNLPGLLTIVCQTIRSRAQDVRDVTRETLLKINEFLGTAYFQFIIKELRGALARGYELHVLGYTVSALLNDMASRMNVGDLDYCMEDIVQVLISDIFGKTGQEKDTAEITGKTKEAKSRRSPAAFELLAKLVKFSNIGMWMMFSNGRLMASYTTLDLTRLNYWICKRFDIRKCGCIQGSEEGQDHQDTKEKNFEVQMKRIVEEPVDHLHVNSHRFVYFGLSLLHTSLKRNKFDLSDDDYATRLDKILMTVGNILYSAQTANVTLAARNLNILYKLPLSSVNDSIPVAIKRIFQLLKHSPNTNSPMIQACFRLLTVCIQSKKANLTEHQLTYLINIIRPDLEEPTRQGTAFGLVRGVISRKFMAPEMYDLMDVLGNILVTNQVPETREQARSLYFMFLMDYPQGRGRLKKQMTFITKNLEYSLLLALVMRLINDESSKCREMTAELIKSLLVRMDDDMDTVYKLLDKWMDSEQANLQRAGCQLYGLVIDAYGKNFKQWMDALEEQEKHEDSLELEDDGMDVDIPWEVGYYSLNTFAKVTSTFPKLVYTDDTIPIWRGVESLLLHPHAWIRSSSSRLFGVYFAGIDVATRNSYLTRQVLRGLAYGFVEQLKGIYLSDEQANQLVKNLFFIGRCLYHLPAEEDVTGNDDDDDQDGSQDDATSNSLLAEQTYLWIKVKYTHHCYGSSIKLHILQEVLRSSIFKWFAAMCNVMKPEELSPYLFSMIAPIYHTVNGQVSREKGFDDLKTLGNEVLGMIQKKAGPTAYFAIYQNIRQHSIDIKEERKAQRAVESITNPELAAKRKWLAINANLQATSVFGLPKSILYFLFYLLK